MDLDKGDVFAVAVAFNVIRAVGELPLKLDRSNVRAANLLEREWFRGARPLLPDRSVDAALSSIAWRGLSRPHLAKMPVGARSAGCVANDSLECPGGTGLASLPVCVCRQSLGALSALAGWLLDILCCALTAREIFCSGKVGRRS